MNREEIQTMVSLFKTLANESRLKIMGIVSNRECSVEELATLLRLTEPTISHHLSKLKAMDLVSMKTEGNTHLYSFNGEGLWLARNMAGNEKHVGNSSRLGPWRDVIARIGDEYTR